MDLSRSERSHDLSLRQPTVANHKPMSVGISFTMTLQILGDFVLNGPLQHLLRTLAQQLFKGGLASR
jgi:hypothetical protein